MHQPALDRAAWASRWRTRNVGDKALLSLGLLIVAVSAPVWPGGVAAGAMAVACALVWARVPVGIWARAVAAPTVFIAVGVLAVAISLDTSRSVDAVWRTGPIAITTPGLVRAAELVGRGFAGMTAVVLLAATTPMVDLLTGLRRLRIPDELIEVAANRNSMR